jgi:hypothetical protein
MGNATTSRCKQETSACKIESGTSGAAAAVEATATRCLRRLWRMTGGGGGIGGGVGVGVGGTVATMG